jgi:ABC-type branched-subunit amino acid transport system ATPase component/branched-subunit amino acid ABC-type transport system permease component
MTRHLVFLLLGTGSGAVFAALALGLVLTYRSSGVVNFATGALALYAAYTYQFLREGRLLTPLPGFPESIDLGRPLAFAPALVLALLLSSTLGALLYLAIFRPLRTAPPVAKAVASLGVMVVLQSLLALRLGTNALTVGRILPRHVIVIGGLRMQSDRLWFAAVIVAVAVGLALLLKLTRFGLATRAAAESEKGALVTGLSPDRIALANWALSSAVAGLGGILIAPIVPLVPSAYTLFIVPALAAALVANFQALALAVGAALVIGMAQSELAFLETQHSWLPQHGLAEIVPLVLIMAFLVVRGRPLPQRGALLIQTLGRAPRPRRLTPPVVLGSAAGLVGLLVTSGSYRAALITSMILAVISLSLVVVTGFAGQVSLAQLALAGVGAFLLSRFGFDWSIPFPIAPLLAAGGATVVGVVIGLPALRIRGLPVAVVTLALAVGVEALWFRNPDYTGGIEGARIRPPSLFGIDLGVGGGSQYPRVAFGVTCLVVLVLVAGGVALLRNSRFGAAMLAVRANERAAAAVGINVARTKLLAFAVASFIAGLGGSLLAYQQTLASPDVYQTFAGFALFATAYVAGITSIGGGILAGFLASGGLSYLVVTRWAGSLGGWYEVVMGGLLILQVVKNPEGLVAGLHRLADRLHVRRAARPVVVPAPPPAGSGRAVVAGPAVLVLDGVTVRYGGVEAVSQVSFEVARGLIVGLIGPNGAGKTTLIDAISGFTGYGGSVSFGGALLDGLRPHARSHRGLGRTFQGLELWEDLSVEENVVVGRPSSVSGTDGPLATIDGLLELLTLHDVRHRAVRELSQGQRQLVSIARTLATGPQLVLLDEPAAGLDSTESEWLAGRLREVRDTGTTILMVDHDMSLVLGVCDVIHVLDLGVLIASGSPSEIRADPTVAAAYLGSTHAHSETPA